MFHIELHSNTKSTCTGLTWISQFQCFFGLDEVVPVIFKTSELPFKDCQHASCIIRSKVTLRVQGEEVLFMHKSTGDFILINKA